MVFGYVFVWNMNFWFKCIYFVIMLWRVFMVMIDDYMVDDWDYVGNKCLEFVG